MRCFSYAIAMSAVSSVFWVKVMDTRAFLLLVFGSAQEGF